MTYLITNKKLAFTFFLLALSISWSYYVFFFYLCKIALGNWDCGENPITKNIAYFLLNCFILICSNISAIPIKGCFLFKINWVKNIWQVLSPYASWAFFTIYLIRILILEKYHFMKTVAICFFKVFPLSWGNLFRSYFYTFPFIAIFTFPVYDSMWKIKTIFSMEMLDFFSL